MPRRCSVSNNQFDWRKRRQVIYASLGFCGGIIITVLVYAVTHGNIQLLAEMASSAWLGALAIVGSYVFGATWDDLNARKWGTPMAPAAEVPAPDRADVVVKEE